MRRTFVPWMIVLALGFTSPVALLAFEPLSEAELDRTVASGVQAPLPSEVDQARQGRVNETAAVSETNPTAGKTDTQAEEETSDTAQRITLIAYREALPIVMSRMTNASRGPLGRNGSYSLFSLADVQGRKPTISAGVPQFPSLPFPAGRIIIVP